MLATSRNNSGFCLDGVWELVDKLPIAGDIVQVRINGRWMTGKLLGAGMATIHVALVDTDEIVVVDIIMARYYVPSRAIAETINQR